jgi:hypothetical protein
LRAIIDQGVAVRLVGALVDKGRDVSLFPDAWRGLKNGALLAKIVDAGFGCLITCDKNLRHQQNLKKWRIALVVLPFPRFEDLATILDAIAFAVDRAEPGKVIILDASGTHQGVG